MFMRKGGESEKDKQKAYVEEATIVAIDPVQMKGKETQISKS
ncbi:hypothetical protein ACEQPO_23890 [Bacillus sp. SL00103]